MSPVGTTEKGIEEVYRTCLGLMSHWYTTYRVGIWGYYLLPNHVDLIAVPGSVEALTRAIGEEHRGHTRRVGQKGVKPTLDSYLVLVTSFGHVTAFMH
jgi:hypothetical protein